MSFFIYTFTHLSKNSYPVCGGLLLIFVAVAAVLYIPLLKYHTCVCNIHACQAERAHPYSHSSTHIVHTHTSTYIRQHPHLHPYSRPRPRPRPRPHPTPHPTPHPRTVVTAAARLHREATIEAWPQRGRQTRVSACELDVQRDKPWRAEWWCNVTDPVIVPI
jgi:hypothetical protein